MRQRPDRQPEEHERVVVAALRLRWSSPQPPHRWTMTHAPSPRTVMAIGSMGEPESAARSPGLSSRWRLHRQFGQWFAVSGAEGVGRDVQPAVATAERASPDMPLTAALIA